MREAGSDYLDVAEPIQQHDDDLNDDRVERRTGVVVVLEVDEKSLPVE